MPTAAAALELKAVPPEVTYRQLREEDIPFIFSALLESYAYESPLTISVDKPSFYQGHRPKLEAALKRPGIKLDLACLSDTPSVLLGFVLSEDGLLHYLYVKRDFRRNGIGTALLTYAGFRDLNKVTCTHLTYDVCRRRHRWPRLKFDPYKF